MVKFSSMIQDSIKYVKLQDNVWSMVVDKNNYALYLETRNEEEKRIELVRLELSDLAFERKKTNHKWWTHLVGATNDVMYFLEYQDEHDPNKQSYFSINWKRDEKKSLISLPIIEPIVVQPSIYEQGTDYHKTVSKFLSLDLPLSCEYLEWDDKIIISYYLRSGKGFDRYLLLIREGEKHWKICQDKGIKGFSPGSFFVLKDQLIFIKDRNEVCVYTY